MKENDRKQVPRKEPKSVRLPTQLQELANNIQQGRVLRAETARLILQLQKVAARAKSHLQKMNRGRVLRFPDSD